MALIGLLVTVLGFLVTLLSLGLTSSVGVRMAMVLAGIALSFTGILGLINRAYLKTAIWRK
jgi:hypothetical protein